MWYLNPGVFDIYTPFIRNISSWFYPAPKVVATPVDITRDLTEGLVKVRRGLPRVPPIWSGIAPTCVNSVYNTVETTGTPTLLVVMAPSPWNCLLIVLVKCKQISESWKYKGNTDKLENVVREAQSIIFRITGNKRFVKVRDKRYQLREAKRDFIS